MSMSTASISANILEYRKIHGRTYQNFVTGTEYWQVARHLLVSGSSCEGSS